MSYSGASEALDYFSHQPLSTQHVVSFDGWPNTMCPPWNTMVFPEPTLRGSDHLQAPHLFIQTSRLDGAELEFNQYELSAMKPTEVDEILSPVWPEEIAMTGGGPIIRSLPDSDHFQAPHLFVQTSPLDDAELEFNQYAVPAMQSTEVDEILQTAHGSSPARPEDIAMTRGGPIIRSLPDSGHFQAPHLFVHPSPLDYAELEFNQYAVPTMQPTEVEEILQTAHESSPARPEEIAMTRGGPIIRSLPDSDHFQSPHLFVHTSPLDDEEFEFSRYAVHEMQPTEVDERRQSVHESSPALPEDTAMTRDVPNIQSPTLSNGRPTRPTKSNSVTLNKGRRESLSKTQRQERNKESATRHRERLFKMIDDAWEMIPEDGKRGFGEKRTLKRLQKLEIAIGYFSKLQRIHSQIIALLG